MAGTILLNDEYIWTAAPDLFDWVAGVLLENVDDPVSRQRIESVREGTQGRLDVGTLPEAGREQLLRCLRETLVPAAEADLAPREPEQLRRSMVGHVKVLKLIADDIAHTAAAQPG